MKRVTGFVTKKNGYYHTVVNEPNAKTGKTTPIWRSTGLKIKGNKTKADGMLRDRIKALEEMLEAEKDHEINYPDSSREESETLFAEYLLEWLNNHKENIEATTLSGYRQNIKITVNYFNDLCEKKVTLENIDQNDITKFYQYLLNKRKVCLNTVKRYHANIKKALKDECMQKNSRLKFNPADNINIKSLNKDVTKKVAFIPTYYTKALLNAILECITGDIVELPVKLTAFYGLRRGEAMGALWSAINLDERIFKINHTVTVILNEEGKQEIYFKDYPKNKKSIRTYPITDQVYELLLAKEKSIEKYTWLCGNCYSKKFMDYVMVDQLGIIYDPNLISRRFKRLLLKHIIPDGRFHDLRHAGARLLLANNAQLKFVSDWLGHSSINTTADIYGDMDISAKQPMAQIMEESLKIV